MAITKKAKVRKNFLDYQLEKSLSYPGQTTSTAFEEGWARVTEAFQRKLNSDELWDYYRVHILPSLLVPKLPFRGYDQPIPRAPKFKVYA